MSYFEVQKDGQVSTIRRVFFNIGTDRFLTKIHAANVKNSKKYQFCLINFFVCIYPNFTKYFVRHGTC